LQKIFGIIFIQGYNINMAAKTTLKIPKFQFREPRRNLPNKSSRKNAERDFTIKFARSYVSRIELLHHGTIRTAVEFAREIPINGFGIADFVAVHWNPKMLQSESQILNSVDFCRIASPIIRAFELKISNWRKAIMQAIRYKYFADAAIVVLHVNKFKIASEYLNTFRTINVGLWTFDPEKNQINALYTPKPSTPLEPKYKPKTIGLVAKASKSQHFA
jgi:hypothetical protein